MKLGDYLKAINYTKVAMKDLGDDFEFIKKKYSPFIVNKCLSFFPDSIFQANNMNINHHLDKDMQYEYLLKSTRKRNRFGGWSRKSKSENLDIIKKHFGYSNSKAEEVLDILTDSDINNIRKAVNTGG
tara:strand:- start:39 stop:422 length:384 start_codon:yes stop_codon:yes gene_type:complete